MVEKEIIVWETSHGPADVVPGLPAGCPLRCALTVTVDRWRTARFVGRITVGFAAVDGHPLVFGQCLDTMRAVVPPQTLARLGGLWERCHRRRLTALSAEDRSKILELAS